MYHNIQDGNSSTSDFISSNYFYRMCQDSGLSLCKIIILGESVMLILYILFLSHCMILCSPDNSKKFHLVLFSNLQLNLYQNSPMLILNSVRMRFVRFCVCVIAFVCLFGCLFVSLFMWFLFDFLGNICHITTVLNKTWFVQVVEIIHVFIRKLCFQMFYFDYCGQPKYF